MDESTPTISVGCTITIPARRFDDPEGPRWSEAQFGDEANTKQLEAVVLRQGGRRWRVRVLHDDTY